VGTGNSWRGGEVQKPQIRKKRSTRGKLFAQGKKNRKERGKSERRLSQSSANKIFREERPQKVQNLSQQGKLLRERRGEKALKREDRPIGGQSARCYKKIVMRVGGWGNWAKRGKK